MLPTRLCLIISDLFGNSVQGCYDLIITNGSCKLCLGLLLKTFDFPTNSLSGVYRVAYNRCINPFRQKKLYFLEVNTVPGMSETSIVPQQVAVMGFTMNDVFGMVIEDAIAREKN